MAQSNYELLVINFLALSSKDLAQVEGKRVHPDFLESSWYKDTIYVLQNLQDPPGLTKTQARFIKLKAAKFCIINEYLYWKNPRGTLLNCLLEKEVGEKMQEFHKGDCGGHLYWKTTTYKILRAGF